jgi:hypothetical protein
MVPVDGGVHFGHVQVIICDIKLGSLERSRDVKNETVLEKIKGYTFRPHL